MINHKHYFMAQCLFCGGKRCKYEREDTIINTPQTKQAIKGLNSHWVTHDIIASQRPSNRLIDEFDIITQFKENKITDIINLQEQYEHPNCGDGILENGFSYDPEKFMNAEIKYYNFLIQDMESPSITTLINIMQLMHGALIKKNRIFFIHCHAGRGRTGLLIASYLLWSQRFMTAKEAIDFVRIKRPKSIQTGNQVKLIHKLEREIKDLWTIFVGISPKTQTTHSKKYPFRTARSESNLGPIKHSTIDSITFYSQTNLYELDVGSVSSNNESSSIVEVDSNSSDLQSSNKSSLIYISLKEILDRQKLFLYGSEARQLQKLPKIIFVISSNFQSILKEEKDQERLFDIAKNMYSIFSSENLNESFLNEINTIKQKINNNQWNDVENSRDPKLLMKLLVDFLDQLQNPVLLEEYINCEIENLKTEHIVRCIPSPEIDILLSISRFLFHLKSLDSIYCQLCTSISMKLVRDNQKIIPILELASKDETFIKKSNREILLEMGRRDSLKFNSVQYS